MAPGTDLLELYCGGGSHTVALAPFCRHVLAVEVNRQLVKAAEHNVELNGLSNVKVLRAPSEEPESVPECTSTSLDRHLQASVRLFKSL